MFPQGPAPDGLRYLAHLLEEAERPDASKTQLDIADGRLHLEVTGEMQAVRELVAKVKREGKGFVNLETGLIYGLRRRGD